MERASERYAPKDLDLQEEDCVFRGSHLRQMRVFGVTELALHNKGGHS